MWMTDYIREVQAWFKSNVDSFPVVPDGNYDMVIDGKLDHVKIVGGKINCCNFDRAPKGKADARFTSTNKRFTASKTPPKSRKPRLRKA